jgi:phosphoribosylformimino-5-aminoimidazole carboxamide ribonucleotide (ProFAR) isomerase
MSLPCYRFDRRSDVSLGLGYMSFQFVLIPNLASNTAASDLREWQSEGCRWFRVTEERVPHGATHSSVVVLDLPVDSAAGLAGAFSEVGGGKFNHAWVVSESVSADSDAWLDAAIKAHPDQIMVALELQVHAVSSKVQTNAGEDLSEALSRLEAFKPHAYLLRMHSEHFSQSHTLHAIESVVAHTKAAVYVAGCVKTLESLNKLIPLAQHGLRGAFIGDELAAGLYTYPEAVAALQARFDMFEWGPAQV